MAVLRATLVTTVAFCWQNWVQAAQAPDDICMLQKNAEVNEAPLMPSAESLSASLQSVVQQLPSIANATSRDIMRVGHEIMVSSRDQHFRNTLHEGLNNFTNNLHNFSVKMFRQARNLVVQSKNQSRGRTFFLLEHYTLTIDDVMANMAGSFVMLARTVLEAIPDGELATSAEPMRRALSNLTRQKVTDYLTSAVLRPKTKRVFDDRATFCSRFMASMNNNTRLDDALLSISGPGIAQAKQMLPLMTSMLTAAVPDVSNDLSEVLNTTLDVLSKSLVEVNGAFHLMIRAMSEVATNRLNCTLPDNMTLEEFSGFQESSAAPLTFATAASELGLNSASSPRGLIRSVTLAASLMAFCAAAW